MSQIQHSTSTPRAAVIGCGGMGRNHAHALAAMPDIELVGLSDVVPEALQRACNEVDLATERSYLNFEELLDQQQPDFIVVATQAPQHAHITITAAQRGIHVLCEKPLALNLTEADAMVQACADAGVRLAVNHLRRTAPASVLARDRVAAGDIGEILAVDIHDKGGRPVGNTLMEMATHYFDEARFLLSKRTLADGRRADELEWIYARLSTGLGAAAHAATPAEIMPSQQAKPTDRDCGLVLGERGTVVLGFAGEVQGVARFHNLPKADARYDGIDMIGTEGALSVRGGFLKHLYRRQGHTFAAHDPWQPVDIPDSADYFALDNRQAGCRLCQEMARDLVAAINEAREPVSSGRDGLVALESLMAVYVSHRCGQPVALPLADRRHPLDVWQEEMV